MHVRAPVWLKAIGKPGAGAFATIFALESCVRAILATVIVIDVRNITGSAQATSLVFFAIAFFGIFVNFAVPGFVRVVGRRWVYTGGAAALILASLLLMVGALWAEMLGMALRVFGVICFNICLNLYILDTLKGQQINRLEPLRIFLAAVPWFVGPSLGVTLAADVDHRIPFAISIAFTLVLIAYFWVLRTKEDSPLPRMQRPPASPLAHVLGFFARPRLRLSYAIAVVRSTYWSMFFVYGPLYCIETGLGEIAGGYLVSAGNAFLFIAPLIGRMGRRLGIRRLIVASFALSAAASLGAFFLAGWAWAGALLLLIGALGAVVLDVTGNVPFLRLVRPSERMTMTPVFATYRDFSDCVPPGIFSVLLLVFKLPVVFLATGIWLGLAGLYATRLPRRL